VNSLYIGIGVAIIAALLTALVGPYFVDWTAYRSVFEREGQRIFGENVTVLGQAQVRLLPAPSVLLDDVVIGPVDHPNLKIDRLELKLEMTPLMKGEVRISELRLDRPVVRMGLDAQGTPVLPGMYATLQKASGGTDVGAIALEFAEIVDGRVLISDARNGAETTIDGLNGTASAAALSGPLKLEGGASIDGHPFTFRFSTGRRGDDGLWPMRLQANPTEAPYQLNVETSLDTSTVSPKATGTFALQRLSVGDGKSDKFDAQPTPWQLNTTFAANAGAVTLDGLELSVGEADASYSVTGKGRIDIGASPKFDIELAAKQVDLDRLIARKIDEPADPQVATSRLQDLLLGLPKLPLAGRLRLGIGGVVIGGGAVQDVNLDVRTRADGWAIDAFSARLPGRSLVTANGRLVVADASTFAGQASLASEQPIALLQWWKKGPSPALEPFSFAGHVAVAAGSIKVDELSAKLGSANARGALQWAAATPVRGPRLKATLSADKLDLDQAKVISGLVSTTLGQGTGAQDPVAPVDGGSANEALPGIDLDLDAGVVLVAGEQLKGVTAKAVFDGSSLTIDHLAIRDAIGAAIDVKGRIDKLTTTPDGSIDGSVRADRLGGLVHLVETLNPGQAWVKRLVAAAPALGPLAVKARLTGDAGTEASNVHLTLDGTAAGSTLSLEARFGGRLDLFRQGALDASLQLDGPDGGLVLRQIGIPASSDSVSAGKLQVSVKGTPATGLAVIANADVAGSRLACTCHAAINEAGAVTYDAEAQLTATDLRTPATMFGQALPSGGATVPLDLRAHIDGNGAKAKISSLSGHLAEAGVVGGGEVDLAQWPLRIDGNLQFTQADMITLLELGIGSDAFQAQVPKGGVWPGDVIAGPVFSTLNANIDLKADRLTIDQTRGIDRFAAKLRLRPGQVLFDEIGGRFASGDLTGALGLATAAGGEIGLMGNLQMKGARLGDIVWRRDDRAVADGAMDLAATFDSSGRSIAALAASLNGNGALTVTDGMLRYVDPDAFGAIIAAADGGLELKDDKIRAVFQGRLDAGTLPFQRIEAAFSIGSGVLRVNNINVTSQRAQAAGSASLDFGRWTMDADWTLKVDPGKNGVVGAQPQVGVLFRGPIDQPKRTLDVTPLSAFLTLRAFEREVERVEDLQQDIIERQRFQRELKREKDERARRDQEQKAAEAAARQKAIDDAKAAQVRLADEARKADDARKAEAAKKADDVRKAADDVQKADAAAKAEAVARESAAKAQPAAPPPSDDPTPQTVPTAPVPAPPVEPAPLQPLITPSPSGPPPSAAETQPDPPKPNPRTPAPDAQTGPSSAPMTGTTSPDPSVSSPPPATTETTQSRQTRAQPPLNILPDLPPIIFVSPKPPIMPFTVPTSPSAQ
jgi:uncharacterized protein involved in outer membrane biogenesis